ncbi:DUF459 domain-containing protein [Rhizobium sp. LCM 4573]|uniref:SGNH/GDSL hydrolase family protein n=1 Tax=Rhizobium sp. LCM 4573 TaxID=1848291 RepID=UPI0008DAD21B|nr:DUF459 domain-containing protein [Rhizobium sp. LCM 4573]OHV84651.1 hypothetical protein LCM4573_03050 [Rhizobium sp. LCM 4573]
MTVSRRTDIKPVWGRLVAILLALVVAVPPYAPPAAAQERRNLLEMLFGIRPRQERYDRYDRYERYEGYERYERRPRYNRRDRSVIETAPRRQRDRSSIRAATPRPQRPAAPPKPALIPKLENARKILVVGDFLAGGLADELETAFETSPSVAVENRTNGSSGLVREDHYDWPPALPKLIGEVDPAIVVVMIGANDRQQMQIGSISEKFRTDAWFKEYEQRVSRLAAIATARKLPLLWVGLPSFQSPSMMADAVTLNGIYRDQVEKAGGEFVDIWDGFVDEEGKFILTGSDMNGQQARLRGGDGITFTTAGKRKLAFYVEKLARRHLGEMTDPDLVKLDGSNLPALATLPPAANAVPTQPISLADPELDGGTDLLGAGQLPVSLVQSPRELLVKRGELPPAPSGRVDDYRIPAATTR